MPQIWIRLDASGLQPVMVDEQDELPCTGDVDWHFVAVVEDRREAERLSEQLRREHEHRAPAPNRPSPPHSAVQPPAE